MNILLLIKPITILVAPLYLADTTVAGSQPLPNIIQNIYQRPEHNQSIQRRIKCQWVNKIDLKLDTLAAGEDKMPLRAKVSQITLF